MSSTSGTARSTEELMYLFRDGQPSSAITAQDMRDFVASIPTVQGASDIRALGVAGDAELLLDGAIASASTTLISGTANFTGREGQVCFVVGAGASGADLLTTIVSVTNASSCVLSAAAGTTVSGAEIRFGTDDTAGFQAAFDSVEAMGSGCKFIIPHGRYITTASLTIRNGVSLEGEAWGATPWERFGTSSTIMCCANVPVIQCTDAAGGWYGSTFRYLSFRGTSRAGSKGLYSVKTYGLKVYYCDFYLFGDHAIHLQGGVFTAHIKGVFAASCHMVKSKTEFVGVIDLEPSDCMVSDCEVTSSEPHNVAGYYGNGKIAAYVFRGVQSFVRDCMGHHSQIGFYVLGNNTTFVNCRADHNQGHGWVVDAFACNFIGCRSLANLMDATDTYSAFVVNGGNNTFNMCQVGSYYGDGLISQPIYGRYKHAFLATNDLGEGTPNKFFLNDTGWGTTQYSDGAYEFSGTSQEQVIVRDIDGETISFGKSVPLLGETPVTLSLTNQSADADERVWALLAQKIGAGPSQFVGTTFNDAGDVSTPWMVVEHAAGEDAVDLVRLLGTVVHTFGQLMLKNGVRHLDGLGDPNGSVTGSIGDTYSRKDGGAVTSFYVKESGTSTNTGWVGK